MASDKIQRIEVSPAPTFNSIRDLAEYYGVSRATIQRRIKDGTLKVHRLGPRTVRIRFADAEKAFGPNQETTKGVTP